MSPQYGELRPTSSWDPFVSLGHPSYFQRLLRLGRVTAWQSSSERQPNFAALNRGRHLCAAGRPSRWALAHISISWLVWLPRYCCSIVFIISVLQSADSTFDCHIICNRECDVWASEKCWARLLVTAGVHKLAATTATTTTTVFMAIIQATFFSQHAQLKTGGFCYRKILLSTCRWWQLAHSD